MTAYSAWEQLTMSSSATPFGIYLHSPFCKHKCGYCDFNSWAETRIEPQDKWVKGIQKSSEFWSRHLYDRATHRKIAAKSFFWGGGTPSLVENSRAAKILQQIHKDWAFVEGAEKTIEVNPETLTEEKLQMWFEGGVNRLSMGVQSFSEQNLDLLERHARPKDNIRSLEMIVKNWKGRSWSLDLMFGLPGQSLEDWKADLEMAMIFKPPHVSAYQLTLTTERSKNWKQPVDTELEKMFDRTAEFLESKGYKRYEVSNFSKPGHESVHNKNYWETGSFIGLGPGAAGLISKDIEMKNLHPPILETVRAEKIRELYGFHQKNPDNFDKWESNAGVEAFELKNLALREKKDEIFECLMMGLRLQKGIPLWRLPVQVDHVAKTLDSQWARGNFEITNAKYLKTTPAGLKILDSLLPKLFKSLVD